MRSHHDLMLSLAFASLAVAATARAEVRVLESEQHYLLDASTKAAFRKQLAEQLGHRETGAASRSHGLTDADIETGYELLQEPGHCTLSRVRVVLRLETTLPRWEPTEPPSAALAADGSVMLAQFAAHATGHRAHAIEAAHAIERQLRALPAAADCKQTRRDADRIVRRELIAMRARDSRYDAVADMRVAQGQTLSQKLQQQTTTSRSRVGKPRAKAVMHGAYDSSALE